MASRLVAPYRRRLSVGGGLRFGGRRAISSGRAALGGMPARRWVDTLEIPDVYGFLAAAPASAVARNQVITGGYQQLGVLVQDVVDPGFASSGVSRVAPNWFAMGAYVSNMGGKNMVALSRARALLAAQPDANTLPPGDISEKVVELLWPALVRLELTRALGAMVVFVRRQGGGAGRICAPGVIPTLVARTTRLLDSAAAGGLGGKVDQIMLTAYNALSDGNLAIYRDIGSAAQDFFEVRHAWGPFDDDVSLLHALGGRWRPRAASTFLGDAMDVAAHCRANLGQFEVLRGLPERFSHLGATRGLALLGAGFVLYEQARRESSVVEKNRLIAAANALVALREQRDIVQGAFEGRCVNEIERSNVFELVTPFITIAVGPECWEFKNWAEESAAIGASAADCAAGLSCAASSFNWAVFEQRWAPILDFFERMYERPDLVWVHDFDPDPRR